jgi:hypothetical protein
VGDDIPAWLRDAWYDAWNLGVALDAFCVGCRSDMSVGITELSKRHKADRLAFLSHTRDSTMSAFLMYLNPADFESALGRLQAGAFAPTANARVFYVDGASHMLLHRVAAQQTPSTALRDWLEAMVSDDAGWASVTP